MKGDLSWILYVLPLLMIYVRYSYKNSYKNVVQYNGELVPAKRSL